MRLTCPNCAAQYEVPEDAIPPEGRDVQCSNCGQTWFARAGDDADDTLVAEDSLTVDTPEPAPVAASEADAFDDEIAFDDEDAAPPEAIPAAAQRPSLSEEAADVLRQEAAREKAQRDQVPLETQTEMGLQEPPKSARPVAEEVEPTVTEGPTPAEIAAQSTGAVEAQSRKSRRDLLPDIEEINSSLRATSDRATAEEQDIEPETEEEATRRGFRLGFGIVALAIACAILAYARADDVVAALPALEEPMANYVITVNGWRVALDGAVEGLLERLEDVSG